MSKRRQKKIELILFSSVQDYLKQIKAKLHETSDSQKQYLFHYQLDCMSFHNDSNDVNDKFI